MRNDLTIFPTSLLGSSVGKFKRPQDGSRGKFCVKMPGKIALNPLPPGTKQPGLAQSLLYSGSRFQGHQKSKGNRYDVEVVLKVSPAEWSQLSMENSRRFTFWRLWPIVNFQRCSNTIFSRFLGSMLARRRRKGVPLRISQNQRLNRCKLNFTYCVVL